jgi:hypothetical protein
MANGGGALLKILGALSAWRARRALPTEPDADRGVIAFLLAAVYLAAATALTTLLYRLLSA